MRSPLLAPAFAILIACSDNAALPGTMLGTYSATGTQVTNTCGAGIGAPTPWTFNVQMSEQTGTLYWSWMDGNPPVSTVMSGQQASFTGSETGNVDATPDGGAGPCTMARADSLEVTLATGSPPPSFAGTVTYNFSVVSGADCTDQLSASGGMYDALPCTLSYTVTATHQ